MNEAGKISCVHATIHKNAKFKGAAYCRRVIATTFKYCCGGAREPTRAIISPSIPPSIIYYIDCLAFDLFAHRKNNL